jgi:predicted ATP-grasp superfamily ATP-dependent carboligase
MELEDKIIQEIGHNIRMWPEEDKQKLINSIMGFDMMLRKDEDGSNWMAGGTMMIDNRPDKERMNKLRLETFNALLYLLNRDKLVEKLNTFKRSL